MIPIMFSLISITLMTLIFIVACKNFKKMSRRYFSGVTTIGVISLMVGLVGEIIAFIFYREDPIFNQITTIGGISILIALAGITPAYILQKVWRNNRYIYF